MTTAVQLRPGGDSDQPRCDLVHGEPVHVVAGELGPVALFNAGRLVAYRLRLARAVRLYVFRTGRAEGAKAARACVPGVRPCVDLLFTVRSVGRVRLAERLFACLTEARRDPKSLPDAFYVRVGAALAGRKLPRGLLDRHLATLDSVSRSSA